MTKRLMSLTLGVVVTVAPLRAMLAVERAANTQEPVLCYGEHDGEKVPYSDGALRRVAGQRQKCEQGKWVLATPAQPVPDKAKPCVDVFKQEYASGLFRESRDQVDVCTNGKWIRKQG